LANTKYWSSFVDTDNDDTEYIFKFFGSAVPDRMQILQNSEIIYETGKLWGPLVTAIERQVIRRHGTQMETLFQAIKSSTEG